MKEECQENCTMEISNHIFSHNPILWLSTKYFSIKSIKKVSQCILSDLPYYKKNKSQLTEGLTIGDELGPVKFSFPLDIISCHANIGCNEFASEVVKEVSSDVSLVDVPPTALTRKRVFLLYLNEHTFRDEGGEVQLMIRRASEMSVPIVLVHEQTEGKGAHPFYLFFGQTPQDLINPSIMIYKSIATPLYYIDEYRKVSLRQIMSEMGATSAKKIQILVPDAICYKGNDRH